MVPVIVDNVAGVGRRLPDIGREKIVLWLGWPAVDQSGVQIVFALDLLQENDIGAENPQLLPQFMHHEVPVELREAFVDVVGDETQTGFFHGAHETASILSRASLAGPASCSGTLM